MDNLYRSSLQYSELYHLVKITDANIAKQKSKNSYMKAGLILKTNDSRKNIEKWIAINKSLPSNCKFTKSIWQSRIPNLDLPITRSAREAFDEAFDDLMRSHEISWDRRRLWTKETIFVARRAATQPWDGEDISAIRAIGQDRRRRGNLTQLTSALQKRSWRTGKPTATNGGQQKRCCYEST